jgi:hypothetical protein
VSLNSPLTPTIPKRRQSKRLAHYLYIATYRNTNPGDDPFWDKVAHNRAIGLELVAKAIMDVKEDIMNGAQDCGMEKPEFAYLCYQQSHGRATDRRIRIKNAKLSVFQ